MQAEGSGCDGPDHVKSGLMSQQCRLMADRVQAATLTAMYCIHQDCQLLVGRGSHQVEIPLCTKLQDLGVDARSMPKQLSAPPKRI